jgi:hypothetical protein
MKNVPESVKVKTVRIANDLFSLFSEKEILSLESMRCLRGGDGDGNGSDPIIIIPPKPV